MVSTAVAQAKEMEKFTQNLKVLGDLNVRQGKEANDLGGLVSVTYEKRGTDGQLTTRNLSGYVIERSVPHDKVSQLVLDHYHGHQISSEDLQAVLEATVIIRDRREGNRQQGDLTLKAAEVKYALVCTELEHVSFEPRTGKHSVNPAE